MKPRHGYSQRPSTWEAIPSGLRRCQEGAHRLRSKNREQKYKRWVQQFQQNRMLHLNQRQFYRNLENQGRTTKVNDTLGNSKAIATFWWDMSSLEKKHNQQATWIEIVKDIQKDMQEQQVAKITVHEDRICLRTMAGNWKSPEWVRKILPTKLYRWRKIRTINNYAASVIRTGLENHNSTRLIWSPPTEIRCGPAALAQRWVKEV